MKRPEENLVLGEMKELGEYSAKEHQALVDFEKRAYLTLFFGGNSLWFSKTNFYEKKTDRQRSPSQQYRVFAKGSRSKLEERSWISPIASRNALIQRSDNRYLRP